MVHILDDPDVRSRYFAELRLGKGRTNAAKIIGLKRRIVADYAAKTPDFALDMADAEGEPIDDMYEAALILAKGGFLRRDARTGEAYEAMPDLEAIKFLLPRLDRDRFGDKAVVEHQHTYKLENADELAELGERLLRRQRELERGVIIDVPLALPSECNGQASR